MHSPLVQKMAVYNVDLNTRHFKVEISLKNRIKISFTLTWQVRPSLATNFFKVTHFLHLHSIWLLVLLLSSDFRRESWLKSRPSHQGSLLCFLSFWSKWIHKCTIVPGTVSGNFRTTLIFALFAHFWASAKLKTRESFHFVCRSM